MSNGRRYNPSRRERVLSLKEENARLKAMLKFQSDQIELLNAQLATVNMERPADLEDWINEVALGDLDDGERAEWDAMNDDEREAFVTELGRRLAAVEKLVD